MHELERLERILPPMQRLQVLQGLSSRAGRIRCRRRSPGKQPGSNDAHHAFEPLKQAVGALQRKPDVRKLSSRLHRPAAQDPAKKDPSLPRAKTMAEQAVAGTQAPRPPATALFRAAPNPPSPNTIPALAIKMSTDKSMPTHRPACSAFRATHCEEAFEKSLNLIPAFKETFHPASIRRRGKHLNRRRG